MRLADLCLCVSGGLLSDLYFNHEHPAYDAAYAAHQGADDGGPTGEEIERAALADAAEFVALYIQGDAADPAAAARALADDFLHRL